LKCLLFAIEFLVFISKEIVPGTVPKQTDYYVRFRTDPDAILLYVIYSLIFKETNMFFTIGIILLVLWLLGLVTSYTLGGFIYVALVIGIVMLVLGFVRRGSGHK